MEDFVPFGVGLQCTCVCVNAKPELVLIASCVHLEFLACQQHLQYLSKISSVQLITLSFGPLSCIGSVY